MSTAVPSSRQVVVLRIRDGSYTLNGELYMGDSDLVTLPYVDPQDCTHQDQNLVEIHGPRVCPDCLDSWACDWEVWLPSRL